MVFKLNQYIESKENRHEGFKVPSKDDKWIWNEVEILSQDCLV